MTVGMVTVAVANALLNAVFRNVAYTQPTAIFVKLHTADPGAAATNAPSAVTTRASATFSAAASGAVALSNTPSFSMTSTETLTHLSIWDASSAGNFLWSVALTASKNVTNGDTFNLGTLGFSFTPLAA